MHRYVETVIVSGGSRSLCTRPYPGHRKGCPNHGKKVGCPPSAPLIHDVLNLERPIPAVWVTFDMTKHRKRMLRLHPSWSIRQQTCCLYWQQGVRKRLRDEVEAFSYYHAGLQAVYCPEGAGVNVTETMKGIEINLEWPPLKVVHTVAIVGFSKQNLS